MCRWLQCDAQSVAFLKKRVGGTNDVASDPGEDGSAYVEEINAFAKANGIPVVRFTQADAKEDVARGHIQAAAREGRLGLVMLGALSRPKKDDSPVEVSGRRGNVGSAITRKRLSSRERLVPDLLLLLLWLWLLFSTHAPEPRETCARKRT